MEMRGDPMQLFLATHEHDQQQSLSSIESAQPLGGTRRETLVKVVPHSAVRRNGWTLSV